MQAKDLTQEYMKPTVDFIGKYADLVLDEKIKAGLTKMVSNFDTAWKGAKEDDEKKAYLNIIYVTNARSIAANLVENDALTDEVLAELRALPSKEDAHAIIKPYLDEQEAIRDELMQKQMKFAEHNNEIEVLKGIAFGDNPTKARKGVEEQNRKAAEAVQQAMKQ